MDLMSLLVSVALSLSVVVASTHGPIVGIFAHPISQHGEYIAASYVKWVESAGGRVVPIPYNAPKPYLEQLLPQLNGLLFPGGSATVNDRAEQLFRLALGLNDKGVYFPVWGTCLGFEWLLQLTTKDMNLLNEGLDSMNISLPLNFTKAAPASRLFSQASPEMYSWLHDTAITMNNHELGITPERFNQYLSLTNFYNVLATNVDRKGVEFISAIEAKKYPIYGVQFHPEKNSFEYGEFEDGTPFEDIDHSLKGVGSGQFFANFFISEARKNELRFKSAKAERKALIYNYQTSTVTYPGFVESYIFKHDFKMTFWSTGI
ncbi:gamma-glutamyl hydrolase a [Plasmopara halstedii]|uniref:folate gamma-glutamyl hydrolase n=1 Tax=Plasmopara halstedii TaxID=4781 RepID=A0A0P1A979_PLAHL|nr:gamma-glutamyl hydrolase a [Plasmopara halstedii]CEG36738.1 gamma-glutamyl hydrolase a [Plasmopara halstedii]|eukprot:XP_024573107.1 gamma-glutamyl hydrolase a [Plasmopara halstedii]